MLHTIREWNELSEQHKAKINSLWTITEIAQQPTTWLRTLDYSVFNAQRWQDYVATVLKELPDPMPVLLSGAGSSFFAGLCAEASWREHISKRCEARTTTDILTHPKSIIDGSGVLLVSFSRSGQNPESLHSINLVRQHSLRAANLVITPSQNSALVKLAEEQDDSYIHQLDPTAADRGLAMTSSFSNMVIAAQILGDQIGAGLDPENVRTISRLAENLLNNPSILSFVENLNVRRAAVLGDGPLLGAAKEGMIKILELTDGCILGMGESFLHFRHGFSCMVHSDTLLIYLVSSHPDVRRCQLPLIKEIRERRPGSPSLAVTLHPDEELPDCVDQVLVLDAEQAVQLNDSWRVPLDVVVLQIVAFGLNRLLDIPLDQPFRHRATAKAVDALGFA